MIVCISKKAGKCYSRVFSDKGLILIELKAIAISAQLQLQSKNNKSRITYSYYPSYNEFSPAEVSPQILRALTLVQIKDLKLGTWQAAAGGGFFDINKRNFYSSP